MRIEPLEQRELLAVTTPLELNSLFESNGGDGSSGFVFRGRFAFDEAGTSVSSAGDVNGDGLDDLIVGANHADPFFSTSNRGQSYVVFGSPAGFPASVRASDLDGTNGFTINGIGGNDQSGISVSGGGDINGDGLADLLIGAIFASPNGLNRAGTTFVVFGTDQPFASSIDLSALNGSNGFAINGVAIDDFAGQRVAMAGDINGDGYDDVAIGARRIASAGVADVSHAYVVFGKAGGFDPTFELRDLDGTNGFTVDSPDLNVYGLTVGRGADFNGDGFDDLLIGAHNDGLTSVRGRSFVVYGKATGYAPNVDLSALNGANGFVIEGVTPTDSTGEIASAGDVNGDGREDLLVGARAADRGSIESAGAGFVVFGGRGFTGGKFELSKLLAVNGGDGTLGYVVFGVAYVDSLGAYVASAGDVNADGYDDVLFGAPIAFQTGRGRAGISFLLFGHGGSYSPEFDLRQMTASSGVALLGNDYEEGAGIVGGAGDLDGDGFGDIVIGAPRANPNETVVGHVGYVTDAGVAYVLLGRKFASDGGLIGDTDDNTLTGSPGNDRIVAALGNDTLIGGGGYDVIYGGAGDDIIRVANSAFMRVSGGNGIDVLAIDRPYVSIVLPELGGRLSGIEEIDLRNSGPNSLSLTAQAVLRLSDTTNVLVVRGDAEDTVLLDDGWQWSGIDTVDNSLTVYTKGASQVRVTSVVSVLTPDIELSISEPSAMAEGDGEPTQIQFIVTRNGALNVPVSVEFETVDGTAKALIDYIPARGRLEFSAGQMTALINVPLIGNTLYQSARQFSIELSRPIQGAAFGPSYSYLGAQIQQTDLIAQDFNGDGRPDWAATGTNQNGVVVQLNTTTDASSVQFFRTGYHTNTNALSVAAGDINLDGHSDLVVTNSSPASFSILLNDPVSAMPFRLAQSFELGLGSLPAAFGPPDVAIGDINRDGLPDIVLLDGINNDVAVFINRTLPGQQDVAFAPALTIDLQIPRNASSYFNVSLVDMNADGTTDVVVSWGTQLYVFVNKTEAPGGDVELSPFQSISIPYGIVDLSVEDINSDGRSDILFGGRSLYDDSGAIGLLLNQTAAGASRIELSALLAFTLPSAVVSVVAADLNNDSMLDLAASTESIGSWSFINAAEAQAAIVTFSLPQVINAELPDAHMASADFDSDGRADLLAAVLNSKDVQLLLNRSTKTVLSVATAVAHILDDDQPASLAAVSGGAHEADIGSVFIEPLKVLVRNANGKPIEGVPVQFNSPSSGPSASFANGGTSLKLITDVAGTATASITANGVLGSYGVLASIDEHAVVFELRNVSVDLSIQLETVGSSFVPGTIATYSIVVANNSDSDVAAASISVPFPSMLSDGEWTAIFAGSATGQLSGTGDIVENVRLPAGSSIRYQVTGRISPTARGGFTVFGGIESERSETIKSNNAFRQSFTFTPSVDLSLDVVESVSTVVAGAGSLVYTVRLFNSGPSDASDIVIGSSLSLSPGVDIASDPMATNGEWANGTWTVPFLAVGDSAELSFVLDVGGSAVAGAGVVGLEVEVLSCAERLVNSLNDTDSEQTDITGSTILVTGADAGGGPHVKVYDLSPRNLRLEFFAFDPSFTGGVRVAVGDVNGDGAPDVIAAAGPTGGPHVRVFDGRTGQQLPGSIGSFFAYDPRFSGGVFVAAGDVNGDGAADIVTGADAGGGPHVRVFDGKTGAELYSFFAFDPYLDAGVRVATGDIDGDGLAEVVAGMGPGYEYSIATTGFKRTNQTEVRVFSGASGDLLQGFEPFEVGYRGGVHLAVAMGEVIASKANGDGRVDRAFAVPYILPFLHSDVAIFQEGASGQFEKVSSFEAYAGFTGSTRLAAVDSVFRQQSSTGTSDEDAFEAALITGAGPGGGPHVRVRLQDQSILDEFFAYSDDFTGGLWLAAG